MVHSKDQFPVYHFPCIGKNGHVRYVVIRIKPNQIKQHNYNKLHLELKQQYKKEEEVEVEEEEKIVMITIN